MWEVKAWYSTEGTFEPSLFRTRSDANETGSFGAAGSKLQASDANGVESVHFAIRQSHVRPGQVGWV